MSSPLSPGRSPSTARGTRRPTAVPVPTRPRPIRPPNGGWNPAPGWHPSMGPRPQ
jgi:hypothetical protein